MTGKKGETPSNEELMPGLQAMVAERRVQPGFIFPQLIQLLALFAAFLAMWQFLARLPNRREIGPQAVPVTYTELPANSVNVAPLKLAGAWELSSPDPRFGGFSGLAVDQGRLLALTDQGFIARLAKPDEAHGKAIIQALPDGPSSGHHSWNRDTEALARDPSGRGWWVAFEKHHELWLFDAAFRRGLKRVRLGAWRWPTNLGVEGLIARPGPELLIFPEASDRMFRMRENRAMAVDLQGRQLLISEAVSLPGGGILAIERSFSPWGFENRLVGLLPSGSGYRIDRRIRMELRPLDNIEGMAAESLPDGSTRLWMISDDNFQRPLRTLLLAVDLPGPKLP